MTSARIFRFALLAFVGGVFAGSFFFAWSPSLPLWLIAVSLAFASAWPNRYGVALALACLSLSWGFFSVSDAERYWTSDRALGFVSGEVRIVRAPERKDAFQEVVARFVSCESALCPSDLVSVRLPLFYTLSYGEAGRISCEVESPAEEWRMYYAKDGIGFSCRAKEWASKAKSSAFPVRLRGMADRFEAAIGEVLPEPESSLAKGLLLGGNGRLPQDVRDDFRVAGLSHIVAVSGYNISIIAGYFLLIGIALFLPRKKAAILALVGTLAFVFIAGAPSSALRAVGMAGALILSWWFGRRYASLWAILLVAALMLLWSPLLLRHDLGFILSFFATLGIALFAPWVERVVRQVRHGRFFLEAFLLTLSAELFILPILFFNFGVFSLVTFPTNTILLPLVPLAMLATFFSAVFGMVVPALGYILAFPTYAVLHLIISGASYAASFDQAVITSDTFGWGSVVLWYAVLGGLVLLGGFLRRRMFDDTRV